MPTLKMEVEVVQSTYSTMMNQYQTMTQALQSMTTSVNNTVGNSWQGNSSMEFRNQYEQIQASMKQNLERLQQLADILKNEITQWEATGNTLG